MLREEAEPLLERFLNAVTTMAVTPGPLKERLAWVTDTVGVFADADIPDQIRADYDEFVDILYKPSVPKAAERHPVFVKTVSAYYLPPAKAKRAAELLVSMFEAIVYADDEPTPANRAPTSRGPAGAAARRPSRAARPPATNGPQPLARSGRAAAPQGPKATKKPAAAKATRSRR
jgi:hypothetical protein